MEAPGSVIDLGCGVGQDSAFFAKKGFLVRGIDQSKTAIDVCKKHKDNGLLSFTKMSFLDIETLYGHAEYMYLRFVLCAIDQTEEELLLPWIQSHIAKGGKLFIETRSVNDTHIPHIPRTAHNRRLISKPALEADLKKLGFKIAYSKEKRNFSPIEGENPLLIRIVAVEKGVSKCGKQ